VLSARSALSAAERAAGDAARTRHLLESPLLVGATRVAAYISVGTEPATATLVTGLRACGVTVLLPRLQPDGGLDLIVDDGRRVAGLRGTVEPPGPAAAADVVAAVDVWLVPALAVDRAGVRLGRGGGSYDRLLAVAVPLGGSVTALLHEGELVDALPSEPHDRPVSHVALPGGVVAVGPAVPAEVVG
jgi:5-formyltetrahydrofolate cyclo-ligase